MSTTTTATFAWTVSNPTGNVSYTIKYRLTGTSIWNVQSTSGTTASISGLAINRIYDFQVENVNNLTNPLSAISTGINITDPGPAFSPINTSISYSFGNLSVDIDSYTTTIALFSTPGTIISTHLLEPSGTINDTFTGLLPLTKYLINITPTANQFYKQFSYAITTALTGTCPIPVNPRATLSS